MFAHHGMGFFVWEFTVTTYNGNCFFGWACIATTQWFTFLWEYTATTYSECVVLWQEFTAPTSSGAFILLGMNIDNIQWDMILWIAAPSNGT